MPIRKYSEVKKAQNKSNKQTKQGAGQCSMLPRGYRRHVQKKSSHC